MPEAPAGTPGIELSVASYNVHKCVGTDGQFDPGRVVAVLAELGADLVALQEVDRRFGRRTALLDPARLAQATGLQPLPVSDLPDGMGWHGNALLVRPGTRWQLRRIDLPGAEPRGAVIAELTLPGRTDRLRVVAAHFGLLRRCRTRQVETVLAAIGQGKAGQGKAGQPTDMPTLLLGDLNEWRLNRARNALTGLEAVFGGVTGGPPSFPSRRPFLRLDRILGCAQAQVLRVEAHDTPLARLASDHLPLKAQVRLPPAQQPARSDLAAAA
ncbi:EEP domain-containing protein [Roseicella frigidaeris]|uniref:EEP domain-containing protein n=2 Tax=Roseicella frigidaeris TaxID=2230885 RepID=A0A327MDR2_9PROT|nr:EEP domain-containing protein [Roseicella frigidaeris]